MHRCLKTKLAGKFLKALPNTGGFFLEPDPLAAEIDSKQGFVENPPTFDSMRGGCRENFKVFWSYADFNSFTHFLRQHPSSDS